MLKTSSRPTNVCCDIFSRNKRVRVRFFPCGKTEDIQHHVIPHLKKKPDNIIIHIQYFFSNDHNGNNIISSSNYKSLVNDSSAIRLGSVKSVLKHPQQILIGRLNIYPIRNKFDIMKPMLMHDTDIFMVTETCKKKHGYRLQLTETCKNMPVLQFNTEGFSKSFRLDQNNNCGCIIFYIFSATL